jgi:signal transduction histidine kinase
MERRVAELASLNVLSQRMAAVMSVEEVVPSLLAETMRCVEPDMVLLFRRQRTKLIVIGESHRPATSGHASTPVHRVGQCLCGLAIQTKRPLYSADIRCDHRCTWEECKRAGFRSFAALPLTCGGQVLGVLGLASRKPRDFAGQAGFIETLANAVAVSLRNAELYDRLRRQAVRLTRSERGLREMGRRLIDAQEEERRRLARELHDDLNQRLSLLAINLEVLAAGKLSPKPTRAGLRQLVEQTRQLCSDVHRLSYQLHPSTLEQLGLVSSMSLFCRSLGSSGRLRVHFVHHRVPRKLPPEVSLCLYRVLQESLWNVLKHSGADEARAEMSADAATIRLTVSDTGKGFDVEASSARGRLGLTSMRERLRVLGGSLSVESRPGQGTQVVACVPLLVRASPARRSNAGKGRRP